jgi:cyclic pyranopterin monophosphate synthase
MQAKSGYDETVSEEDDPMRLRHLDEKGRARMVDVSGKPETVRTATAAGRVYLRPETLKRVQQGKIAKGNVLAVAQVAGILGAKQVPALIPLCHPLPLSGVELDFEEISAPNAENRCSIAITATVRTRGRTGVEMEAMTAVCAAALAIYDMCKAVDREMSLGDVMLISKSGGRSGTFRRSGKSDPRSRTRNG